MSIDMNKNESIDDILGQQWQDEFQNYNIKNNPQLEGLFQYRDCQIFYEMNHDKHFQDQMTNNKSFKQIHSEINRQLSLKQNNQYEIQDEIFKRQHFDSNLHHKASKYQRNEKQKNYSKAYRQRTKQRYKTLQEENAYLKKRISDLQIQLRQQEIQLNRFKFPPLDKELSIEQFNKQFTQLGVNYLKSLKQKPDMYDKQWHPTESQYHQFFLEFYAERGFAGKKKLNILNYHFNQILQTLLKDTEKYLCLVFANSKSYDKLGPLPQFDTINNAYFQIYKPQGDLWSRLKIFNQFLHPMSLQLNKHISQFYKKYEEILCCCNKIHNFIKFHYHNNMDIGRRRLQMQTWFDFHKYGKSMRKLRQKWFIWMKSLAQKEEQQEIATKNGIKKKKTSQ